jgi:hypothetical protein
MAHGRDDEASTIDVALDVDAFFEEVVHDAIVAERVDATGAAEQYLALLLSAHARGETAGDALQRPLTLVLHEALELRGRDRFEQLRHIGDALLYGLGFFGSSLTRRGADRAYVMHLGSTAYGHASAMLEHGGSEGGPNVLDELARKYHRFVAVLSAVNHTTLASTRDDAAVLRLYERWRRTGSGKLAEALASAGLWTGRGSGGLN